MTWQNCLYNSAAKMTEGFNQMLRIASSSQNSAGEWHKQIKNALLSAGIIKTDIKNSCLIILIYKTATTKYTEKNGCFVCFAYAFCCVPRFAYG